MYSTIMYLHTHRVIMYLPILLPHGSILNQRPFSFYLFVFITQNKEV